MCYGQKLLFYTVCLATTAAATTTTTTTSAAMTTVAPVGNTEPGGVPNQVAPGGGSPICCTFEDSS